MDCNCQPERTANNSIPGSLRLLCIRAFASVVIASVIWSTAFADEQSKSTVDSDQAYLLLKQLNDPSYRVRREAFLTLRDRSLPIDAQLAKEAEQEDPHRSSLAKWLIQLRKSDGSITEQLATVSAYRSVLAGDNLPLLNMVFRNEWNQVLDLLQILPKPVLRNMVEKGELEMFQEQAWESSNSWVVPLMMDLYVSNDQRVAINRWWRDIGMPDFWKLNEPDIPIIQLFQLEADGKIEEAVQFALKSGLGPKAAEAVCIRAADWARWLELQDTYRLRSKSELAFQRLAVYLTLNKRSEAQETWTEIKKLHESEYSPAMVICALAMNDLETHQRLLSRLDRDQGFSHLYRLGDYRGAIGKLGVKEINSTNILKFLKSSMRSGEATPESKDRNETNFRRQLMISYQLADATMEKLIDEFLHKELLANEGTWQAQQILNYWSSTSKMEKTKRFLQEISKNKGYPKSVFQSTKILEGQYAKEEVLFTGAFGAMVIEPFVVFEYFVKEAINSEAKVPPSEAVDQALESLVELFSSRIPKQLASKLQRNAMVSAVRERLKELGRSESEFVLNIVEILDMSGQTQDAIELLISFMDHDDEDANATRLLARLLVKSGRTASRVSTGPSDAMEQAASLMKDLASKNNHDVTLFLETAEILDNAGLVDDLDMLRLRVLSSVMTGAKYFLAYSAKQEHSYETRAEVDLLLDRISRIFGTNFAQAVSFLRYSRCKKDLTQLDKAFRDGSIDFFFRSMNLFKQGEVDAWRIVYQNTGIFALKAIADGDQQSADYWIQMAYRLYPSNIDYPIDVIPSADKKFPKEVVDAWFDLFFRNMLSKIEENPDDATLLNNTAWLCACCDRNLDKAKELATLAVEKERSPTYIDTLAEVEFRLGNMELALDLSLTGREMDPRDDQHRKQIRRFGLAIEEKNPHGKKVPAIK